MKLSAPKMYTWIIGVVIGVLGWIGHYVDVPFVTSHNFGFVLIGFVILALATIIEQA